MGDWKYYELIATFYRAFVSLMTQGTTGKESINRTFDDFWFLPEENNILTNMISLVQYIDVKIALGDEIADRLVDLFNLQQEKLNALKLEDYLSPEEIEHLKESIEETVYNIKRLKNR